MLIREKWKRLLLPMGVIAVTAGILWLTNISVTPREPAWDDVVAEAANGGYRLINTDELWRKYQADSGSLLLIDTRQEWEFAMGHIAGSINFPMEPTAWSRWWKKGDLAATLGQDKNRVLVFY